jgi:hypothetical protein
MPGFDSLKDALDWEHMKYVELIQDANDEHNRKIAHKVSELAHRGMLRSGNAARECELISVERIERIALGMIEFRRQSSRRVPELASRHVAPCRKVVLSGFRTRLP